MLPQPIVTMILLFPSKCKVKTDESKKGDDSKIFFLRQVHALDDACGTIAMVHSVANNVDLVGLADGPLKTYVNQVKDKSPEERGQALADNKEIHDFHHSFCKEGLPPSGTLSHFLRPDSISSLRRNRSPLRVLYPIWRRSSGVGRL